MAVVIRRPVSKSDKLIALGIINDVNKEMESHLGSDGEPIKMENIGQAYTEYLWLSHMKDKMNRAAKLLGFNTYQELRQYMDMGFDVFEERGIASFFFASRTYAIMERSTIFIFLGVDIMFEKYDVKNITIEDLITIKDEMNYIDHNVRALEAICNKYGVDDEVCLMTDKYKVLDYEEMEVIYSCWLFEAIVEILYRVDCIEEEQFGSLTNYKEMCNDIDDYMDMAKECLEELQKLGA